MTRLELLDAWVVSAVNAYSGTSFPEAPCLFVEATGTRVTVEGDLELVQEIARSESAVEIVFERDSDARSRLWKARHSAAHAAAHKVPGSKERVTDVCVPLTELAKAVHFARSELDRLELEGGILGHAGDGNLHISLHLDPNDPTAGQRSDELVHHVVEDALARGGTCTGEHGIGIGKIEALEQEHGDLIPLMTGIKAVFDPLGIMNPGKVLPVPTLVRSREVLPDDEHLEPHRSAVVFGARNLGRAVIELLLADGWSVAAAAVSDATLRPRSLRRSRVARGRDRPGSVHRVLREAAGAHGEIDLVVNAASAYGGDRSGPFGGGPVSEAGLGAFDAWATAPARSAFSCLSASGAFLLERGRPGTVIQVTGGSSRRAAAGRGLWAAGAFGVRAITQAAALELRESGSRWRC